MSARWFESRLRVRYVETDAMGIVHHSNHVVWMELARVELMAALGIPYTQVEARGLILVVSSVGLTYRQAARFDDGVVVEVRVGTIKSRMMRFEYTMRLEASAGQPVVICTAFSEHIAADASKRSVQMPADLREVFEHYAKHGL